MKQKLIDLLTTMAIMVGMFAFPVSAAEKKDLSQDIQDTAAYLQTMYDVETEQPNETSYWDMLYLARAGVERDNILFELYRSNIATELHETGKLEYENWDGTKSESAIYYAANALALAIIGEDPTNIDGFNLVDKLVSMDRSTVTSLYYTNLPVILIAATQFDDEITDKTFATDIINVLKTEYNNSKWGANWGADSPAMVVAALVDYTDTDPEVKTMVDETVAWLQEQVKADKMTVSNTAEKVLTALSLVGPEAVAAANDSTGKNIVDIVLSFQSETTPGAFTYNGKDNYMASQQGLEAMLAYQRMVDGKVGLYDLSDTPIQQYKQLIEKIDQLPEVIRLEDEATIVALRQLYNSLPAAFQAKVTNIADLEKAEQVLQTLKEVAGSKPDSSKPESKPEDTTSSHPVPATGDMGVASVVALCGLAGVSIVALRRKQK